MRVPEDPDTEYTREVRTNPKQSLHGKDNTSPNDDMGEIEY